VRCVAPVRTPDALRGPHGPPQNAGQAAQRISSPGRTEPHRLRRTLFDGTPTSHRAALAAALDSSDNPDPRQQTSKPLEYGHRPLPHSTAALHGHIADMIHARRTTVGAAHESFHSHRPSPQSRLNVAGWSDVGPCATFGPRAAGAGRPAPVPARLRTSLNDRGLAVHRRRWTWVIAAGTIRPHESGRTTRCARRTTR
jgi:hypothetical protein